MRLAAGLELSRYFIVSIVALAVDTAFFLFLASWMHYALAASIGFLVGAVAHYILSVAFVFRTRKLASRKNIELAIFIATGVGGVFINVGVIAVCIEYFSASILISKLLATGVSFVFGYSVRKLALF